MDVHLVISSSQHLNIRSRVTVLCGILLCSTCIHAHWPHAVWLSQCIRSCSGHLSVATETFLQHFEGCPCLHQENACACAKEEMKALPADEQGSWENAVPTADGCWLTRGQFSQHCTFIIKIYTILWYGHACVKMMMWLRSLYTLEHQNQQKAIPKGKRWRMLHFSELAG